MLRSPHLKITFCVLAWVFGSFFYYWHQHRANETKCNQTWLEVFTSTSPSSFSHPQAFLFRIKGKCYYHRGDHKSKSIIKNKTFNLHVRTSNGFRKYRFFSLQFMKHEEYLEREKASFISLRDAKRGE